MSFLMLLIIALLLISPTRNGGGSNTLLFNELAIPYTSINSSTLSMMLNS